MSPLRGLRFMASRGDTTGARSVLLVQSGSPGALGRAVETVRASYPAAKLTVLLQRNMRGRVPLREGVEYLDNEGSKRALVQQLRARRFDIAFALYTDDPGYWKLKVLPLLVGAQNVFAINENMDQFPISLRGTRTLARHLSWRIRSGRAAGTDATVYLVAAAARAAASPAIVAWLFAYEKVVSARAAIRGGVRWKGEHRPR